MLTPARPLGYNAGSDPKWYIELVRMFGVETSSMIVPEEADTAKGPLMTPRG